MSLPAAFWASNESASLLACLLVYDDRTLHCTQAGVTSFAIIIIEEDYADTCANWP